MIRSGEKHVIGSYSRFKQKFNVDKEELWNICDEEHLEEISKYTAEYKEPGKGNVTIRDVDIDLLEEVLRSEKNTYNIIVDILQERPNEYVHLYDGFNHSIVELFN